MSLHLPKFAKAKRTMSTPITINEEYDIISRLATADPDLRILVLEAGLPTYNDPAHTQPARFLSHIAPGSRTMREHVGRPSAALGGRSAIVHVGQCLGGGGSVNCVCFFSSASPPPSFHPPFLSEQEKS